MILPDTNVISETVKPGCSPSVLAWFALQELSTLYLAAPVRAELLLGIAMLPDGKRKTDLSTSMQSAIDRWFVGRTLPFDDKAAVAFAAVMSAARAQGKPIAIFDGQIAAIATSTGATVATRDTAPFAAAGIPTINPWQPQ